MTSTTTTNKMPTQEQDKVQRARSNGRDVARLRGTVEGRTFTGQYLRGEGTDIWNDVRGLYAIDDAAEKRSACGLL